MPVKIRVGDFMFDPVSPGEGPVRAVVTRVGDGPDWMREINKFITGEAVLSFSAIREHGVERACVDLSDKYMAVSRGELLAALAPGRFVVSLSGSSAGIVRSLTLTRSEEWAGDFDDMSSVYGILNLGPAESGMVMGAVCAFLAAESARKIIRRFEHGKISDRL